MKCFKLFIWNSNVVWISVSCFLSLFQCYFWTNWISLSMSWGCYAWRAIKFFFSVHLHNWTPLNWQTKVSSRYFKSENYWFLSNPLNIHFTLRDRDPFPFQKKNFKVNWHFENTMCKSRPTFYQKKNSFWVFVGERTTRFNLYKLLIGGLR